MKPRLGLVTPAALFGACVVLNPLAMAAAAPGSSSAGANEPKTHTLYLGADCSVEYEGQFRPVQAMEGYAFVLDANGRHPSVPVQRSKIKMEDVLKVTPVHATIENLKVERTYTPDNDPNRKSLDALREAGVLAATASFRTGELRANATAEAVQAATYRFDAATVMQQVTTEKMGEVSSNVEEELSQERFDAFDVRFTVSAARVLKAPYVVLVVRYRGGADQPDATNTVVYAEALRTVDSSPKQVRIRRGGLPPGYKLQDVQLHLYDGSVEIATNTARKRLELTADEAFEISVVEYIRAHRGATAKPELVKTLVPTDLSVNLPAAQRNGTVYVKLGKNGKPKGVFSDEACTEKLRNSTVEAVVSRLRFHPALNQGKPEEAVVAVPLAGLTM